MNIRISQTEDNHTTLSIKGNMTIEHVKDLQEKLLEHTPKSSSLTIDFQEVENIDITALQLFETVRQQMNKSARSFNFTGHLSEENLTLIRHCGFDHLISILHKN